MEREEIERRAQKWVREHKLGNAKAAELARFAVEIVEEVLEEQRWQRDEE
jgi:hypothetical protein